MLGVVLGIALFFFLVLIHELGHFLAAKKTGVQVLEFGMGIPPKLGTLWKDKSGTEYTINALPLGGFVRLKGEDPADSGTFLAKDSFIKASFLSKTIILLAGVTVNFLFAWLVLTILFRRGLSPFSILPSGAVDFDSYLTPTVDFLQEKEIISDTDSLQPQVNGFVEDSIGENLGLQLGDVVVDINNIPLSSENISQIIPSLSEQDIVLNIQRGKEMIMLNGTCGEECVLGVYFQPFLGGIQEVTYKFPLAQASIVSVQELYTIGGMTLHRLGQFGKSLFSFSGEKIKKEVSYFSGPVGAVKTGDVLISNGKRAEFFAFGALISFALGLFNLLPIPALDGGRWLGVIIQSIFFRNKEEKYFVIESYINGIFFLLLMILGVYVILKDLVVARGFSIPFIG